jgi:tagatose-1,6-bisphosphate aldolase
VSEIDGVKRFSDVSASDLINFIEMVVGDKDVKDYDVFIEERSMEICVANRVTCDGDSIGAGKIHYKAEK